MDDADPTPDQALRELLDTLVDAFGLSAAVTIEERDGTLRGSIDGEGVESLIGEEASVLDAIQHLAQRFVLRGGEGLRIVVDVNGYRLKREVELAAVADAAAATAVAEGRAVPLPAMPAAERRVVHEHLRDRTDVATHSEGEEPDRHLVVAPVA